jgi:hypothetical protein
MKPSLPPAAARPTARRPDHCATAAKFTQLHLIAWSFMVGSGLLGIAGTPLDWVQSGQITFRSTCRAQSRAVVGGFRSPHPLKVITKPWMNFGSLVGIFGGALRRGAGGRRARRSAPAIQPPPPRPRRRKLPQNCQRKLTLAAMPGQKPVAEGPRLGRQDGSRLQQQAAAPPSRVISHLMRLEAANSIR